MNPARDLHRSLAWTLAALAPLALAALVLGMAIEPEAMGQGAPWRLVGLDAPGCAGCALCGMSRAFSALGHGRLDDALAFHPAVVVVWPLAWLVALGGLFVLVRNLTPRRRTCRSPR